VVAVQPGAVLAASPGMAVADLDADGHPDLVAHRFNAAGGDDLLFFKGVGDGTFAAARVIASDLGATVNDVAVGDLDGDGKPDLVLAQGSFATVLLGNGNGTFRRPTTGSDVVSGVGTYQVQLVDLDGDGRLDLVVGAGNGPAFHRGDGLGGFGPPRHLAIGVEAGGYPFALADLDGDGLPDLVAGHGNFEPGLGPAHDYLTVLRNDSGPRADLAVALAGAPAPVHVAEPLDWTVTVANHGPDAATGVTVRQPLRHGASFGSAGASQGSCTRAGDVVTCSLGTVAANASATTTVRVVPTAAGTLWHTASARSALADPGGGDDGDSARVTVLSASADLGLTASAAPDPVTVGGSLTYTFTATNHGPSAATGVTFTDALPAAATFLSAATTAGTCAHLAGTVTCAVGTLPASGQARITIAVSPQAAGALGNQGTVSGVEADPAAANNAGSAQVTVEAASAGGSGGGGCGCTAAGDPVGLTLLGLALLLRRRR
jgi:uncharacterized repeat protein (TIGR01451 family)/MYXO-CTERM domain-containing protein